MGKRSNKYGGKYGHLKRRGGQQAARYRRTLESTQAEAALCRALEDFGVEFQQNYTVRTPESFTGFYLADFRIPSRRLFVELDGKPHASEAAQWRDRLRTEAILKVFPGYRLIRAWNSELLADPDAWVEQNVLAG